MSPLPPPPHSSCKKCSRWIYLGNFRITGESLGTCTMLEITTSEFNICPGFRLKPEPWASETCGTCLYFDSNSDPAEACSSSGGPAEADDVACPFWTTKENYQPQTNFVKKLTDIREQYIKNGGRLLSEEEVLNYIKEIRGSTGSTK